MPEVEQIQADVLAFIHEATDGFESVVELGAGRFEKLEAAKGSKKLGVEACQKYIDLYPRDNMIQVCGDMREFKPILHTYGFERSDCCMMIDSLEHIEKTDGHSLLERLKPHFKRVAVFAPVGFIEQTHDAWDCGNEYHQTHKSGWLPEDLEHHGFDVRVASEFHITKDKQKFGAMFGVWNDS